MPIALALVHHANQFLITDGYDSREGLATVLGGLEEGQGLTYVLALHQRLRIPLNLHLSGTLLEAIAWHAPQFLEQVKSMRRAGLVDFVGSCYGQNIMRFFDAEYNRRQINEELLLYQMHLDVQPGEMQVFWPPERVWETTRMAPALRDARLWNNGYRYVLVDDRNLLRSRDEFDEQLPWRADLFAMHEIANGIGLMALPIATSLRRSIPPRQPDEWMKMRHDLEALLVHAEREPVEPLAVYADDMEKVSGIWGEERVSQYERFLEWLAGNKWVRSVKLTEWASAHTPAERRHVRTGTFAELAKEFQAGEAYEKWFYSEEWAPYRENFLWSQRRVKECAKAGADQSLIELAEKHLLVSAWETAWHTPATGAHGDPENHSQPSPWAKAIASHSRHSAVIGEAALWMAAKDGGSHSILDDIDNDGEEEVVLKNDELFAVITPKWGGRLITLFSVSGERGVMLVGNPSDDWNFMQELNRFMAVPRNHPGCFADVGHEDTSFVVVECDGGSVKLIDRQGVTKTIRLDGSNVEATYELPKRVQHFDVDCGLSPDYLQLLRSGASILRVESAERCRRCSAGNIAISVSLPQEVSFASPPSSRFGHGVLVRARPSANRFTLSLRVEHLAAAPAIREAA